MDVLLVQGIRRGAGDEIHLTNSSGHFSYPVHLILFLETTVNDKEKEKDRDRLVAKSTPGIPNTGALKEAVCTSHRHIREVLLSVSVSAVRHLMDSKCFTSWIFCNQVGT